MTDAAKAARARASTFASAALAALAAVAPDGADAAATEFCLDGEFDLGARLQGMAPVPGELSGALWCVVTEDETARVQFSGQGLSNPDMAGEFTVAYLPPDLVRIVNGGRSPDIEFEGAEGVEAEALRNRRLDPRRLVEEIVAHPEWSRPDGDWRVVRYPGSDASVRLSIGGGRLRELSTTADLPLRGRVPVRWHWDWSAGDRPTVSLAIDGTIVFSGRARWRELGPQEAAALWRPSPDRDPINVPGDAWPARIDMRLEILADGVHIVSGVRTGFQHLVVETGDGLVVADAPAGWVELHQIPPADLVPGLGISGLSERFIDFLETSFPDQRIRAVALTHAHDDHSGGARAFAAAGASVYAPAEIAGFLERALNRETMPDDRLRARGARVSVRPVSGSLTIDGDRNSVRLVSIGAGPHVSASLGVWAVDAGLFYQSDLHVPNSDADVPRADRLGTECWFADWAVKHLPAGTLVVNSHTAGQTPISRLASYLRADGCQSPPPASATNSTSKDATDSSPQ